MGNRSCTGRTYGTATIQTSKSLDPTSPHTLEAALYRCLLRKRTSTSGLTILNHGLEGAAALAVLGRATQAHVTHHHVIHHRATHHHEIRLLASLHRRAPLRRASARQAALPIQIHLHSQARCKGLCSNVELAPGEPHKVHTPSCSIMWFLCSLPCTLEVE